MTIFNTDEILAPDPELEVLHDREYRVRAFRKDPNLLVRGSVRDQKPPRLYIEEDDQPLTIHHMQVDLEIAFPSLQIVDVTVHFETHPNDTCPLITTHYDKLVGLSIARGFTHRVRELFGGPQGCTHTTALLQAMAPVAVQCVWSMRASQSKHTGNVSFVPRGVSDVEQNAHWKMNLNTCHVWDEEGEFVEQIKQGAPMAPPLFAAQRMKDLGLDPDEWRSRMRG